MADIVQLPPPAEQPDLLVGPFTEYRVIVEGREIPRLTGAPDGEGMTALIVDRRFMQTFPDEEAPKAAWLIAQALAIGDGYSHLGAQNRERPFAPQVVDLGPETPTARSPR